MTGCIGVVLPTRYPEPLLRYLDLVRRAEDLGLATAWFTEIAGADAVALAAAAAPLTERIRLATGVVPVATRTPQLMAMGALTLQGLSGGRAVLGLGASTPAIIEGWHGRPADVLLEQLEETIGAVRAAMVGEDVHGPRLRSTGFHPTVRRNGALPIYLAALGPKAIALAARSAEGVILTLSTAEHLGQISHALPDPASDQATALVAYVRIAVDRDAGAAMAWMARELAWYGSSKAYRAHFRRQGFVTEMDAVELAWSKRDQQAAVAAISDDMCRRLSVIGSAAEARAQVEALLAEGADEVACYFIDADREGVAGMTDQLERLARA
ncbi:MAG: LLM class flavin-dependent oxidoreductase [Solirubrobacteraceae bacterium]